MHETVEVVGLGHQPHHLLARRLADQVGGPRHQRHAHLGHVRLAAAAGDRGAQHAGRDVEPGDRSFGHVHAAAPEPRRLGHAGHRHRQQRGGQLADRRAGALICRRPGDDRDAHRALGCRSPKRHQVAQRVGGQLAEPRLAGTGADHRVGERALVGDERIDPFFDGALAHQLVHEHRLGLPDAPRPVGGLVFDGGVPPPVVVHHSRCRGEVQARAARLQRHEQQRRGGALLELGHHAVATLTCDAAVQEGHVAAQAVVAEAFAEVPLQQQAHLAELGEHERLLAGVEQVVDELVEPGELARPTGQRRAVAQRVRGVVADLLQPRERGKHQSPSAHAGLGLGVDQQLVDHALVHAGLLARERRPRDLLDLVGQVGHQRLVGLGAPQHERRGEPPQGGGRLGVAVLLDGQREAGAERVAVAEQAGRHRVDDRPQLAEAVLDRGAGERDALAGRDVANGLGRGGVGVLDRLGLVEHARWTTAPRRSRRCRVPPPGTW